ncbi:L-glyceraldehyde 3-phosphate reductase [Anaerosporobacter faecicola]|uniref:L-glyceraldehyde 3-phosphate reductase n=1 Tax=Anaerosporobacter faecicola TaxID=2718714 RepID=UPI0014391E18|nr:L-glyceraldehyde 3-phosphate reductase [Anaerosporobacter faecicola]
MYQASDKRYDHMKYKKCGNSGVKLPRVALGLWHNFGSVDPFENQKAMAFEAFNQGITHFDLANNYGPVYGSAEDNFGRIMESDLRPYRDEMIISTKAGYDMWPGPYGDGGSRKYLMSSIDQSLKRMKVDYVDIFYHHRFDPDTPLEETMGALSDIVRQGKALYVGISNYNAEQTKRAAEILKENKTPLFINQVCYNMMNRWVEEDHLLDTLAEVGAGCICFSPLAQGVLTNKYLHGIPAGSRATRNHFLHEDSITPELVGKVTKLNEIALNRGQTLAQMALSWVLRDGVTTVLIGASRPEQIKDNVGIVDHLEFTSEELKEIDRILAE